MRAQSSDKQLNFKDIFRGNLSPWGVYHLTAKGQASWFDFAKEIAAHLQSQGKRVADLYRSHFDGSLVFVGVTLTCVDWGACPVDRKIPRVFVHMVAANNILNQDFLAPVSPGGCLLVLATLTTLRLLPV
jgi:hypothetical protein